MFFENILDGWELKVDIMINSMDNLLISYGQIFDHNLALCFNRLPTRI